jgi:hypothetical protein
MEHEFLLVKGHGVLAVVSEIQGVFGKINHAVFSQSGMGMEKLVGKNESDGGHGLIIC